MKKRKHERESKELLPRKLTFNIVDIDKEHIVKLLFALFKIHPDASVSSDIIFSEKHKSTFNNIGRSKIANSLEQHRHVTPYEMIVNTLRSIVEQEKDPTLVLKSLIKLVLFLLPKQDGIYISDIDLKEEKYKDISNDIKIKATRKIINKNDSDKNENVGFLISPNKTSAIINKLHSPTQNKIKHVTKEYNQKIKIFISSALLKFIEPLNINNTKTIISEKICQYILTIYNLRENVSYPKEGNTRPFEIRFYNSIENCQNKNKKYEAINILELQTYIMFGTDINQKIRLVDNQGYVVKEVKQILKMFNDLYTMYANISIKQMKEGFHSKGKKYNKSFNKNIKLTNEIIESITKDEFLGKYNTLITEENFCKIAPFHIAKHLYRILDYKPLEQYILVANRKGNIKLYNNASTDELKNYEIVHGLNHRADEIYSLRTKLTFRNKEFATLDTEGDIVEEDKPKPEILAKKIVEHGIFSLFPYKNLITIEKFSAILNGLCGLIKRDYQYSEKDNLQNFIDIETKAYIDEHKQDYNKLDVEFLGENSLYNKLICDEKFDN